MTSYRHWTQYDMFYRRREMEMVAGWITAVHSGSIVGLAGSGKSNLLGFLGHRPDALNVYLPETSRQVLAVPVDVNQMPDARLVTFFRVILRSFYEIRHRLPESSQWMVNQIYQTHKAVQDVFLVQSALRDLLLELQAQQWQVVLIMDRFDDFCHVATPAMTNTLRNLRDSFKSDLIYLAGMRRDPRYLPNPSALGELYELLDTRVCWVGCMEKEDVYRLIAEETVTAEFPPDEPTRERLLVLTGGYPALLKAACAWWLKTTSRPPLTDWQQVLLAQSAVKHRLQEIWTGLTEEEHLALTELDRTVQAAGTKPVKMNRANEAVLRGLETKGICCEAQEGWLFFGELFAGYVKTAVPNPRGRIHHDSKTGEIYQGHIPLSKLAPLEKNVLKFFLENPYTQHTKTDIILKTWPKEKHQKGVSDDSLFQVITVLRQTIEPSLANPCYIRGWRGHPEGGYQFFPEGYPG